MAAQIATGVPAPAAPSRNAPKQKAISTACNRWSGDKPGHRHLDALVNAARLHRDVVEQHRADQHVADGQQTQTAPRWRMPGSPS